MSCDHWHDAPMSTLQRPWPLRLRNALIPDELGKGWMPFALLGYLLFLFLPFALRWISTSDAYTGPLSWTATWLSLAGFLPLYFTAWRSHDKGRLLCAAGIVVIACVLFRWNAFSNNYIVYAVSFLASLRAPLWQRIGWSVLAMAVFGAVAWSYPPARVAVPFILIITAMISAAVFFGTYFQDERDRKQAALRLSHDEVRRVAAFAERERIGRDLHDLLGHTLSTVALKAELAGKLSARDPAAAKREIDEVAAIARDALAQVRTAVSGIRSALIAAEVASAKVLLEAAGVRLHSDIAEVPMSRALESALAMTLREAATNIERHADASEARITLQRQGDAIELRVVDDGRGGAIRPGNGIDGMCMRIAELGGVVQFEPVARGTQLRAVVPLEQAA